MKEPYDFNAVAVDPFYAGFVHVVLAFNQSVAQTCARLHGVDGLCLSYFDIGRTRYFGFVHEWTGTFLPVIYPSVTDAIAIMPFVGSALRWTEPHVLAKLHTTVMRDNFRHLCIASNGLPIPHTIGS